MLLNCGGGEDSWQWSNQSILKEISPEYSLEKLMLKLKLQYFGHLMQEAHSLEKTLMLPKIEGRRRWGWQRTRWLDVITYSTDMNLGKLWEMVKDRDAWSAAVHQVTKSWTGLSNWTIIYITHKNCICWKTKMHIMLLGILIEFCVMSTNLIWHSNDIAKKNK